MTWLLPTRGRIKNLRRFLAAAREMGTSTNGIVLVNRDELLAHEAAYGEAMTLGPADWTCRAVDADCYGEAVRQAWPLVEHDPWIGLVADDLVPASPGWDVELLKGLTGWNLVSANDGTQARQNIMEGRLHGAIAWSGDLARAVGWIFPPGLRHIFHDDVWETLGRATGCWQVRMDVMTRHLHEAYLTGKRGPTMDPTSALWKHDQAWFEAWSASSKDSVVAAIQALMTARGVKQVEVDLAGLNIMLATPSASGAMPLAYIRSALASFEFLKGRGATVQWATECYTADVALARIKLFGAFMRSEATHLLMIDDDMGWAPEALVRLFFAKKDFVAVAGPKKRYPLQFAASHVDGKGNPIPLAFDQESGTMEVTDVGAAFVLLTRNACEKMTRGYPDLAFDNINAERNWGLFIPGIFDGEYKSEDFAFCRRWKQLGGTVHMVPDIALKHVGTHTFEGSFAQAQGT